MRSAERQRRPSRATRPFRGWVGEGWVKSSGSSFDNVFVARDGRGRRYSIAEIEQRGTGYLLFLCAPRGSATLWCASSPDRDRLCDTFAIAWRQRGGL